MSFLDLPALRYPLIQAPMAGVQGADLAVAVPAAQITRKLALGFGGGQ